MGKAMATIYNPAIYPTNDSVLYIGSSVEYPGTDVVDTFGPIFTPKVYAKDLDVLELASSWKTAFSLADEHAVDLSRQGRNVYMTTRNGNSLNMNSDTSITMLTGTDTAVISQTVRDSGSITFNIMDRNVGTFLHDFNELDVAM
jgi:hypothetical protein